MIIFQCLCRADFGETEVASWNERHEAGFSFSPLVSIITAGLMETCSRTFITSVRFYYLFLGLAELSLSTCHMEGWMNNQAWATNNSSCLPRSVRATSWPVCTFRRCGAQGATASSLQILLFTFLEVLACWSGNNMHVGVWQVPSEFGQFFSPFGSADSARKPFSPTLLPSFPLLTDHLLPSCIAAPTESCPRGQALPALQGRLHTWAAASVHQCQTPSILPLGPALTPCRTSLLHSYWCYVSGLKGSAVG